MPTSLKINTPGILVLESPQLILFFSGRFFLLEGNIDPYAHARLHSDSEAVLQCYSHSALFHVSAWAEAEGNT